MLAGEDQENSLRVNDEFVQLQAPAVLKCKPSGAQMAASGPIQSPPDWAPIEWFTSDGLEIEPNELGKGKQPLASLGEQALALLFQVAVPGSVLVSVSLPVSAPAVSVVDINYIPPGGPH